MHFICNITFFLVIFVFNMFLMFLLQVLTPLDADTLKISLSEFLLNPKHTILVAQCFSHTLLEILLVAEEYGEKIELDESKGYHHQALCIALGKLVNIHPDAVR